MIWQAICTDMGYCIKGVLFQIEFLCDWKKIILLDHGQEGAAQS